MARLALQFWFILVVAVVSVPTTVLEAESTGVADVPQAIATLLPFELYYNTIYCKQK